jgi:hypothetical protein
MARGSKTTLVLGAGSSCAYGMPVGGATDRSGRLIQSPLILSETPDMRDMQCQEFLRHTLLID